MQQQVKQWLEQETVDIFLGYKMMQGHTLPYCFTKENLDVLKLVTLVDNQLLHELFPTRQYVSDLLKLDHRYYLTSIALPVTILPATSAR